MNAWPALVFVTSSSIALLGTAGLQQAPVGEGRTVAILGLVVDGDSGRAIAGAAVSASTAGGRKGPVIADARGRFTVEDVPPGRVFLTASKSGYSGGNYGQLSPLARPEALVLGEGQRLTDVRLHLWKDGVITGRITDSTGQGVAGESVAALRETPVGGTRRFVRNRTVTTDDRGVYRISGLVPSRYVVAVLAGPPPRGAAATGHATVFYPGVISAAEAALLSVRSGEESVGIDVPLLRLPVLTVSGRVSGRDSTTPLRLRLVPFDSGDVAADVDVATALTTPDGHFEFRGIPAGQYYLRTTRFPSGFAAGAVQANGAWLLPRVGPLPPTPATRTLWAEVPVTVDRKDVTGVAVPLQAGARIHGQLKFDGTRARPGEAALLRAGVTVESSDGRDLGALPLARVEADGTFSTVELPPGDYIISLIAREIDGWIVKAVQAPFAEGGGEVVRLATADLSGVTIVLTDRPAELTGVVRDRTGRLRTDAEVYIFPADRALWTGHGRPVSRFFRISSIQNGTYSVRGIAPGGYYLTAEIGRVRELWTLPAVLDSLATGARRIIIRDGGRHTQDLEGNIPESK